MLLFGDVEPFLTKNSDIGPSLRPKLLDMLHHLPTVIQLKVELAIVIDFGEQFVKSTYNLEGDGALIITCYEEILKLRVVVHSSYYQHLEAVIQSFSQGNAIIQHQWKSHAFSYIRPGTGYFNDKFGSDTAYPLNVFKDSRLFSPLKVFEINPTASDTDSLKDVKFFNEPLIIAGLKEELPRYLAKEADVSSTIDILEWWKRKEAALPNWSAAAKKFLLLQQSSAASERVFSLLNNSFGFQQNSSLEDYVEANILLQYNDR